MLPIRLAERLELPQLPDRALDRHAPPGDGAVVGDVLGLRGARRRLGGQRVELGQARAGQAGKDVRVLTEVGVTRDHDGPHR